MRRIVRNTIHGLVSLIIAVLFITCSDQDNTPPAQAVNMNELTTADATILFTLENINSETIQAKITLTPTLTPTRTPPAGTTITVGDEESVLFSELEPISLPPNDSTQIRITALENGTPYTIIVVTLDTIGNARRDIARGIAIPQAVATDVPTNLSARPGNIEVTLTWEGVTEALKYRIYQSVADDPALPIATIDAPAPAPAPATETNITYTDTGLINRTRYSYTVRAVNDGGESGDSNVVFVTPTPPPTAPTNLNATIGDAQVALNWDLVDEATEYRVYRATGNNPATLLFTALETLTTHIDSDLTNGTEYTYTVRALNGSGESGSSNPAFAIPTPIPTVPVNLRAVIGNEQLTVNWDRVLGATEYRIYRDGAITPTDVVTTNAYINTGLTNGNEYAYTVQAANSRGESVNSAVLLATPIEIDSDNNMLIDISSLEELDNIRYNLAGTSYRVSATDTGVRCGVAGDIDCIGYELMRNLHFSDAGSYDSGIINSNWRPNHADPDIANNPGWAPLGTQAVEFATIFEGNNNYITNLYLRRDGDIGFFGTIDSGAVIRNLSIAGSFYVNSGSIGVLVGRQLDGTIINSHAAGDIEISISGIAGGLVGRQDGGEISSSNANGTISGGAGDDHIGGLVGRQQGGTISDSFSTVNIDGNGGRDNAGGLVGRKNGGTITSGYAIGTIRGGADNDRIGGLVGRQQRGNIVASHATGDVYGGNGSDKIGGLVGRQQGGSIVASYSTGDANGGDSSFDNVGGLVGEQSGGTIHASYTTGDVYGGSGNDEIGGLVGVQRVGTTVIANYAIGNVYGGTGDSDYVGGLFGTVEFGAINLTITANYSSRGTLDGGPGNRDHVGILAGRIHALATVDTNSISINANYGFGPRINHEAIGLDVYPGDPAPANRAEHLFASTAGASWNQASSGTLGAWYFGTFFELPTLRYADYDGRGNTYVCDFLIRPPAGAIIIPNCGAPLPGQ